jgi:hypothetical protein
LNAGTIATPLRYQRDRQTRPLRQSRHIQFDLGALLNVESFHSLLIEG